MKLNETKLMTESRKRSNEKARICAVEERDGNTFYRNDRNISIYLPRRCRLRAQFRARTQVVSGSEFGCPGSGSPGRNGKQGTV